MHNCFSFPDLFDHLAEQKINCCRTVQPKRQRIPHDQVLPNKRLKHGDILSRTRDDLMAVVWIYKRDMYVLTNMHNPPATEGNFCDEHGNA
jgi:hypothetical protein